MSDSPDSAPTPAPLPAAGDRLARLAIGLLVILLTTPILIGLICMIELAAEILAGHAGGPLRPYLRAACRFGIYGLLLGGAALAVRRYLPPPHRRRWWIGLGIAGALLLVPYISSVFLLLLAIITFRFAVL